MFTFVENILGMKNLLLVVFLLQTLFIFGETIEVPFTMDDRDRLIRNEAAIQSLRNEMNSRFQGMEYRFDAIDTQFKSNQTQFESLQRQLDNIHTLMYFVLGGIFSLLLLIFWDRRSALAPAKK